MMNQETLTATITAVVTYVGQPVQHGELQRALDTYRRKKAFNKEWMREKRANPKVAQ